MWMVDCRQIEAARIAMTRFIKRTGRIWIRIFPDKPITKSLQKPGWEKEKALLKTGWPSSVLVESFMKWKGS